MPKAPQDPRIRKWSNDDAEAREQEAFNRLSRKEQLQAMVTAYIYQARGINDPNRQREDATRAVANDMAEDATSHKQYIDGPDPRIVVRPKSGRWGDLKFADQQRSSATKKIITNPRAPGRMGLWNYLRDTPKNTDDRG